MTSAFQGTSFVGKGAWSIIKIKIEVFDVKNYFFWLSLCFISFLKLELLTKCYRAHLKKDKNNNPLYICRWKINVPLPFLALRNFLSTRSNDIFILKQRRAFKYLKNINCYNYNRISSF